MFKWQASVAIAVSIFAFPLSVWLTNETLAQAWCQLNLNQFGNMAYERERERQNYIAREWENESSTEWKPKRLSSCLTYITCRNYSGIFGSWPLKLPALIVNEARPPLILLTLPPILLLSAYALPCHKSIRVKFFGQSIKSITKSAIFS